MSKINRAPQSYESLRDIFWDYHESLSDKLRTYNIVRSEFRRRLALKISVNSLQNIASFLSVEDRLSFAVCDRHMYNEVVYGPKSYYWVWRHTPWLQLVDCKKFFYSGRNRVFEHVFKNKMSEEYCMQLTERVTTSNVMIQIMRQGYTKVNDNIFFNSLSSKTIKGFIETGGIITHRHMCYMIRTRLIYYLELDIFKEFVVNFKRHNSKEIVSKVLGEMLCKPTMIRSKFKYLVENGADVNYVHGGLPVLHHVCFAVDNIHELEQNLDLLISVGVDVNVVYRKNQASPYRTVAGSLKYRGFNEKSNLLRSKGGRMKVQHSDH